MLAFFLQYRAEIEILYFLAGIVVAIAASVGLYQLVLTKRAAQANAKSEAFRIAAQQCEFYLTRVIPLMNELDAAAKAQGIISFGEAHVEFRGGKLHARVKQPAEITDKCIAIAEPFTIAMNALEAFAVHFTTGVAADIPGFSCIGRTYCRNVEKLLPELIPLAKSGFYTNIVKLYAIWHARNEKARIEQQKIILDRRNNDIKDVEIKTVGL
ncbi:MAG: hypothetical protein V4662_01635 [Verrucomicrobiota bacterium]